MVLLNSDLMRFLDRDGIWFLSHQVKKNVGLVGKKMFIFSRKSKCVKNRSHKLVFARKHAATGSFLCFPFIFINFILLSGNIWSVLVNLNLLSLDCQGGLFGKETYT